MEGCEDARTSVCQSQLILSNPCPFYKWEMRCKQKACVFQAHPPVSFAFACPLHLKVLLKSHALQEAFSE